MINMSKIFIKYYSENSKKAESILYGFYKERSVFRHFYFLILIICQSVFSLISLAGLKIISYEHTVIEVAGKEFPKEFNFTGDLFFKIADYSTNSILYISSILTIILSITLIVSSIKLSIYRK